MALRKACFLDRDGVVIEEENYISDPARVRLCAGVVPALKKLRAADWLLVVVSNQAGIARGLFGPKALEAVQTRIDKLLKAEGVIIDAWYNCPHHPKGSVQEFAVDCECRKPKPGMLLQAAKEHGIDLKKSVIIGDKISDVEAGFNAGCKKAALVLTGHGAEQNMSATILKRAVVAADVGEAVAKLLESR
jgi:D-glycero-D-manno-heptose 1,7-bisphosphate phosphatase